jgi:hypothetical protein
MVSNFLVIVATSSRPTTASSTSFNVGMRDIGLRLSVVLGGFDLGIGGFPQLWDDSLIY